MAAVATASTHWNSGASCANTHSRPAHPPPKSRASRPAASPVPAAGTAGLFRRWLDAPVPIAGGRSEHDVLVHKMSQWLVEHDRAYYNSHVVEDIHDAIAEILDIITNLVGMLKSSSQMIAVIMLYADRFVKRSGIKHNQLFNLLLTSTVVTVKFWNEAVVVSNKNIAQVFEFSLDDVNLMERRFLAGVEYALCLSEDDVRTFIASMVADSDAAVAASASAAIPMLVDSIKLPSFVVAAPTPVIATAARGCASEEWAKRSAAADPVAMAVDSFATSTRMAVAAAAQ